MEREEIIELKRELSKALGEDMFNPRFASIFNKYDKSKQSDEVEKQTEEPATETQAVDKVDDIKKAEDEREIDKIEAEKADTTEKADDKREDEKSETEEIGKEVDELKDDKASDELADNGLRSELLTPKLN